MNNVFVIDLNKEPILINPYTSNIPRIVTRILNQEGSILRKSLWIMLSIQVAWISTPGWLTEIDVFLLSFRPVPAGTFAPIRTILFLNSSGEIIGFFPALSAL